MQEHHYLVPGKPEGRNTDVSYSITTEIVEDAEDFFVDTKDRLLDPGNWSKFGDIPKKPIRLTDDQKQVVHRHVRRNDQILISSGAVAAGQETEQLFAFIVDALEYDDYPDANRETFAIRMHPAIPGTLDEGVTLDTENSATIVIDRTGCILTALYHGRNNLADAPETSNGLTMTEWESLMKGLIEYFE